MTLTELVAAMPGVQIIGSSAVLNGKYVGHSDLDSVTLTDYGREVLDGPSEIVVADLPVMDVPAAGKGKGGKKAKVADEAPEVPTLDIDD